MGDGYCRGVILGYLWQDEALSLRAASRACREAVAEHPWEDLKCDIYDLPRSTICDSVAAWRRCFPHARAASISYNQTVTDADFVHLAGIRKLSMRNCDQDTISDAAFVHLAGIHTLNMHSCNQDTITDAAFLHLSGIHTLDISRCSQFSP